MPKYDVVIIGGGPGGASAAYWLSRSGKNVAVIEKTKFPRNKACGDGLTPRAILQLESMNLGKELKTAHRIDRLAMVLEKHRTNVSWPKHPIYPNYGLCLKRSVLDELILANAQNEGANVFFESEGIECVIKDDSISEIIVSLQGNIESFSAPQFIFADGSKSKLIRQIGSTRNVDLPLGMALRCYMESPLSHKSVMESHLLLRGGSGRSIPSYGWIFPQGNGYLNIGVGLLTTKGVRKSGNGIENTSKLLERFIGHIDRAWQLKGRPFEIAGGKLQTSFSISEPAVDNALLVGDAAGAINPCNGEGISYALETGKGAAMAIVHGHHPVTSYRHWIKTNYSSFHRRSVTLVRSLDTLSGSIPNVAVGIKSKTVMNFLFRKMSNLSTK